MKVSDVMTRGAISVPPETPLRDLARLLSEERISGVPVVDADGRCLGVVSEADVLVKQLSRPLSRRLPLEWLLGESHDPDELRRRAATTAAEAMTSPAVTIDQDRPLREAATLTVDRGINRLPVVADDRLVGTLSRAVVHSQPFVNLVVTNVPGPQTALYVMGAKMREVLGK